MIKSTCIPLSKKKKTPLVMFQLDMKPIYLPPLPPSTLNYSLSAYGPIRKHRTPKISTWKGMNTVGPKSVMGRTRQPGTKSLDGLLPRRICANRSSIDQSASTMDRSKLVIRKNQENRLIDWVPVTPNPSPMTTGPVPVKESPAGSMWCEKYKDIYVGNRMFYKQFEHWCLNKWKCAPCCIYGASGCGKSALVRECLTSLGHRTLELDICSFPPEQSDRLLRSALQCAGFSKKTVVIWDIADAHIDRVLSLYFNQLTNQTSHSIPLVLITGVYRQFLTYRKKCYCIQVTQRPTPQALLQLATSVLALEYTHYLPVTELIDNCHGNPGRLLCNLQLSTLGTGNSSPSEPPSFSLTEDMRKITKDVFSTETSLSSILSLLDAFPVQLQSFIYTNYPESLDNSDDMVAGTQVSEILSLIDTLPRSYSSICTALALKQTKWTCRYSNLIRIPDRPSKHESIKRQALRMSGLISGMNYDGVLDIIGHAGDQVRYLGCYSRYLFSRNHGEFPYVYQDGNSDPNDIPQQQQLLLLTK